MVHNVHVFMIVSFLLFSPTAQPQQPSVVIEVSEIRPDTLPLGKFINNFYYVVKLKKVYLHQSV